MTEHGSMGKPGLVAHSVLDARFLAAEIEQRYGLGPVAVHLLYRGMNDIYRVDTAAGRYALRTWRATWRSLDEVAGELEYLNFLRANDFPASFPVQACDTSWFFTLEAPEGVRPIALYEWAPGKKFAEALDVTVAARIGGLFAKLHLLGAGFQRARPHSLKARAVSRDNLPHLLALLHDRPAERDLYTSLAETMRARFADIADIGLPDGPCHGDFHPGNVHVEAGNPVLLDFDGCGTDYYVQDVANYVFGNEFYGFDACYGEAFLTGYRAVRPFTTEEVASFDFFLLSKSMRLLTGLAANVNGVGLGVLRFRDLDWFAATIGRSAAALGLR